MKNFFTNNNKIMKVASKITSVLVAFSMLLTLLAPINYARAQDAIGGPFQVFSTTFNEMKDLSLQTVLKQAALAMAGQLLDQMTTSTANWVSTGFDGKPLFVENPGKFFGNVASSSADEFLGRLQNSAANAGSVAWLKKILPIADNMCKGSTSDLPQREAAFLTALFDALNPRVEETGQFNFTEPEIRTFYDQNKPITIEKIIGLGQSRDLLLTEDDLNEVKPLLDALFVAPTDVETACSCRAQAEERISANAEFAQKTKEQIAARLLELTGSSNTTLQGYLDSKAPISDCVKLQEKYGPQDFIEAGGYTRGIIQFLGSTYSDQKGVIESLAPSYDGLPKDIQKEVAQNWTKFASANGTFAAGGWNAWNQYSLPNNNPLASRFLFQNALRDQAAYEVSRFEKDLELGDGFLSAKACAVKMLKLPDGSEKCPIDELIAVTPGKVVGSQIAKALDVPLEKAQSIDDWGDLLKVSLARMAQKLTTSGITALSNEATRQKGIASGAFAGIGGNILAKSSTTNNGLGTNASEILDLEEFFLGKPVQKIKKDANGDLVYEPVINQSTGQPQLDSNGAIVYDLNRPVYLFEQLVDADGELVFELKEVYPGVSLSPDFLDSHPEITVGRDGKNYIKEPVYDRTKPIFEDGFEYEYRNGKPFIEELPAEDPNLVTHIITGLNPTKVKITVNTTALPDFNNRFFVWRHVNSNTTIASGRGVLSMEDTTKCLVGGCHDVYELAIGQKDGSTIYKLFSVWKVLNQGAIEWRSEVSGTSDAPPATGELKLDKSRPLYKKDDNGNIMYESKVDANGEVILDPDGNPIADPSKPIRAPLRRGGALARVYYMNWILENERKAIRELPQAVKALDQCIPGPDYNWDKRLQEKYDKLTQKYGGKTSGVGQHLVPLKEIGQAVYTIMSSYEEGSEVEGCTTREKTIDPRDLRVQAYRSQLALEEIPQDAQTLILYNQNPANFYRNIFKVTVWPGKPNNINTASFDWYKGTCSRLLTLNDRQRSDDLIGSGQYLTGIKYENGNACLKISEGGIGGPLVYMNLWIGNNLLGANGEPEELWVGYNNETYPSTSRPGSVGIGQSIYNLTGNPNNGLDCSGITWYQQFHKNIYDFTTLPLTAEHMQYLGGYKLTDNYAIARDSNGSPVKILNIESAETSREVLNTAKSKYSRKYKQVAEQLAEMSSLKRTIDKLYIEWSDNLKDKNVIAGNIAAIREDLPFDGSIEREKIFLDQIREDTEKIYETTQTCLEDKSKTENFDIYFKDEMQVLYCPLQFHGKMNLASRKNEDIILAGGYKVNYGTMREDVLNVIGSKQQRDLKEALKRMPKGLKVYRWVLAVGTAGFSELVLGAWSRGVDVFGVFSVTSQEKYLAWLSHPSPNIAGNSGQGGLPPKDAEYMCWETSYEQSENAGDKGEDKAINKSNDECFGQSDDKTDGQSAGAGKFAVERLKILCRDFYRSSLSDYNELFGITQNATLP